MTDIKNISDGDVCVWIEQEGSISIKAVTSFGDPVELSTDEAKDLVDALLRFISEIESLDE
jgi:hypothetical protein